MPKRKDIHKILIIGSGPIVIGQACEFDYSGTQAAKALREEGYKVILVNSNPATIMTDPEFADRTYIEPLNVPFLSRIIKREKPDALLPTMGGQTALNLAMDLAESGVLDENNVELIGASVEVIKRAENREEFKAIADKCGVDMPQSGIATSIAEAEVIAAEIGYPLVIRPSFTLAGTGGGIAYNHQELAEIAGYGIDLSPCSTVLVEESIIGWKEYELEVMRDTADNVVIVCPIENVDAMGVHTGDSITVAPAITLTDNEYQLLRDFSIVMMRAIGVDCGGSNMQFAINPQNGRVVIIEMNPRVSRSSALASKATGFPIAKIAAKLAVGFTLDEIPNDITGKTCACFEPSIDYCVVKTPRFAFEKFPGIKAELNTSMKSVGEAMSIGRTFKEAMQKALRSLETGLYGFDGPKYDEPVNHDILRIKLRIPSPERIMYVRRAFSAGMTDQEIHELTGIDPWFLDNLRQIARAHTELCDMYADKTGGVNPMPYKADGDSSSRPEIRDIQPVALRPLDESAIDADMLREAKRMGFSDRQLAACFCCTEKEIRVMRNRMKIHPGYRLVDTCAAEFEAKTPYYYSTYDPGPGEIRPSDRKKVMILGGGPNRIGQGIEFDYCCVHASYALREMGFETIMVNSNPETVSTDYDTSDRLYFEPLTLEDTLQITKAEKPAGSIVQFGGQTPLNLAEGLANCDVPIMGTSPDAISLAEDRGKFASVLNKLGIRQPPSGAAMGTEELAKLAGKLGYPVLVRPSFVLGGRAMAVVYDETELRAFAVDAIAAAEGHPVLVDKFLEDAIEVDVDAVSDGTTTYIGGIMEHIEEAGVHSGDSMCVLPPHTLPDGIIETIRKHTRALAAELNVRGLLNIQFAVRYGEVYILEANPRASRTVPFISKATGVSLAKVATRVAAGMSLADAGMTCDTKIRHVAVKAPVFSFTRFTGTSGIPGPEMKSTGEVMGIDSTIGNAMAKAFVAAGVSLPLEGSIFISVNDRDKRNIIAVAKRFVGLGFSIVSTSGTASALSRNGIKVRALQRISEGRPNIIDLMKDGKIQLLINTPSGSIPRKDEAVIRFEAIVRGLPLISTLAGAHAAADGIEALKHGNTECLPIQTYLSRENS